MFPSSNQHSPIGKGKISISCYINDHLLGKAIAVSFFVAVFCFVLSIMVKKLHAIRLIGQVIFTFFYVHSNSFWRVRMMGICPICNGFEALELKCPKCGAQINDTGRIMDFLMIIVPICLLIK